MRTALCHVSLSASHDRQDVVAAAARGEQGVE